MPEPHYWRSRVFATIDMEIPVKGLLEDARAIEERVREAFERAQANALPAPGQDDDDEVRMVY